MTSRTREPVEEEMRFRAHPAGIREHQKGWTRTQQALVVAAVAGAAFVVYTLYNRSDKKKCVKSSDCTELGSYCSTTKKECEAITTITNQLNGQWTKVPSVTLQIIATSAPVIERDEKLCLITLVWPGGGKNHGYVSATAQNKMYVSFLPGKFDEADISTDYRTITWTDSIYRKQ